ncbi:MAG TPA: glycosyltransferase [Hyphomonadaceae bacterium]|nr:glycosyltransferase [Hyphomonadaceae bacterium]HPN06272.1 glycosyltransferase [Hyphomonadaceae bacterium]
MSVDFDSNIHERLAAAEAALHAVGQQISPALRHIDIAVLIPCYNEAHAIGDVVKSFRAALPNARIFVYDNNSQDNTIAVARDAGAIVRREPLQGKGHVVRRMFSDIEADVYVMVDGDATYDAASAPRLVSRLIETQADMVVGARITEEKAAYRAGHRFGNRMLTGLVRQIFGDRFTDMLSGYRAFSRRFVKSFPALASGFETETELTVHALELDMITAEIQTPYGARREGSTSKLSTIRDGFRILGTIGRLMRDERPMIFFGAIAGLIAGSAVALALPIIGEYMATGLVPRFPTAFLCGTLAVLACISLVSGIILETVRVGRCEMKRLAYNSVESLAAKLERLEETRLTLTSLRAQALAENPATSVFPRRRRTH